MRERTDRRYKRISRAIISRGKIHTKPYEQRITEITMRYYRYPRFHIERHLALNATV